MAAESLQPIEILSPIKELLVTLARRPGLQ
jgi:hypothetical protein